MVFEMTSEVVRDQRIKVLSMSSCADESVYASKV